MQVDLVSNGQNIYQSKQSPRATSDSNKSNKKNKQKTVQQYSKRSLLNILLIIFCTFQVVMITRSKVYIDSSMVRSFLTFYADQDLYPEVFDGLAYYIKIQDISQLQKIMQYMLEKMNNCQSETRNNLDFSLANISLQVQYHAGVQRYQNGTTYIIDISKGIVDPFNLQNTTDLQLFLLKTHFFQIVVQNLDINNEGLSERYHHRIIYHYNQNSEIQIRFQFEIDNILSNTLDYDRPQAYQLFYLRLFYLVIIVLAFFTFYYHSLYVRRNFKQFYTFLQLKKQIKSNKKIIRRGSIFEQLDTTQIRQMDQNISAYVQCRNLDINTLTWKDYMRVVQFDVIFAMLASFLQIISNFYLLFGRQHEKLIGLSCLFAWLTIFRTLQRYQKLTLMYELIKLSILSMIQFSASFFILFLGFTFCGVAIFPKVSFFSSVSDSVTTLFSMLAGDSIDMITMAIADRSSRTLAILYVFSYVIIFMHAIHNTLTSIIKEYFILRQIELIKQQKQRRGEQNFIYIEQISIQSQLQKQKLPLKLTDSLKKDLFKIKKQEQLKFYQNSIRKIIVKLQSIILLEKMEILQHQQPVKAIYCQYLEKRMISIQQCSQKLVESNQQNISSLRKKTITNEQL